MGQIRSALELNIADFSRFTGFSARSISNWERGEPVGSAALRRLQEVVSLQKA